MEFDPVELAWILTIFVVPFVGVVLCWVALKGGRSHATCSRCGYDLRGTLGRASRCPECGTAITRGRFLGPRELSRGWRWLYVIGFMIALCGAMILLAVPPIAVFLHWLGG